MASQRNDALNQELEQHSQSHAGTGGLSSAAASLKGHGMVVVDATSYVAAGEQAHPSAQGKRGRPGGW